jgi:PIN domain nuclease of toxin-antitoxin system
MRVLIDTHTFLWAIFEPKKLSKTARQTLENAQTSVRVSSVTAWEIATKYRIGKLPLGQAMVGSYAKYLARFAAEELPVTSEHALVAGSFRSAHRDPFDRMLAAQSQCEALPLVTCDAAFREFRIDVLW